MKIRYVFYINYAVAVFAVIFSLLQGGDVTSSLVFIGAPQWFAFIVALGYLHAKNVLKAAGHVEDLKNNIGSRFVVVALALWFLVSMYLSLSSDRVIDGSVFFRVSLFFRILSGLMALYLAGVLIYLMYPLQVKFNAGVYKKLID